MLCAAVVCTCCMMSASQAAEYPSLNDAINSAVTPRTYTLDDTEIMTTTLGTFSEKKGFGNRDTAETLTIDGGTGHYGINNEYKTKSTRLLVGGAQSLNLQNLGTYTTTTSDSIVEGKSIITDVIVGESVNNFNKSEEYVGFLRSAGTSNVSNSVFYNNYGRFGAALQNRENGTMSVTGSVFAIIFSFFVV